MCLLYFVGVFAGLALVMRREGRKLAWGKVLTIGGIILLTAGAIAFVIFHYHLHLIPKWPYLSR